MSVTVLGMAPDKGHKYPALSVAIDALVSQMMSTSSFIWPFLTPYMRVIAIPKMAFIFSQFHLFYYLFSHFL